MTRTTTTPGLAVLVAVGAAVTYVGWRMCTSSMAAICDICRRPIHAHTRTVAELNGRWEEFCCATCALTAAKQSGGKIESVELTNYASHAPLDPARAVLVRGGDVNACMEEHALVLGDKQAVLMDFDRCSPSILSFRDRATAEDFIENHGGVLMRAEDLEIR